MQKEWANGVSGNPKNFGVKIKSHEKTQSHLDASIAFGRWKAGQSIGCIQEQAIATEATFWRKYLLRIINSIMALAMISQVIAREPRTRGQWRLPVAHGGNILALVAMQARFDPVLQDLLQTHPIIERHCLWAPECVETPLTITAFRWRLSTQIWRRYGQNLYEQKKKAAKKAVDKAMNDMEADVYTKLLTRTQERR